MKPIVLLSATALAFGLAGTAGLAALSDGSALTAPDRSAPVTTFDLARRGADDGPGHDAGDDHRGRGRGGDDSSGRSAPVMTFDLARRGADDGPGHDAGDDHGGRGRGGDDSSGRGRGGDDDSRNDGGHGGRERIPGGSGCDSAGDIAEHGGCSG